MTRDKTLLLPLLLNIYIVTYKQFLINALTGVSEGP